jgi:hypothetical protein
VKSYLIAILLRDGIYLRSKASRAPSPSKNKPLAIFSMRCESGLLRRKNVNDAEVTDTITHQTVPVNVTVRPKIRKVRRATDNPRRRQTVR